MFARCGARSSLFVAALLGLGAAPSLAQAAEPAIRAFSIPTIEKLGFEMAEQAQQASAADDLLAARGHDPEKDGIRGWIFEPAPGKNRMRFVHDSAHGLEAAYDVVFTTTAEPKFVVPAQHSLDPGELAQFRARQLAAARIEKPCSGVYNTLAVKDPESNGWLVWALATTSEPGGVAVGGHYRFTISADGQTVLRRDALSLSCIVAVKPREAASDDPAPGSPSGRPAAPPPEVVTHLVSDTPVETHVFVSLLYNMRLIVEIPDRSLWQVDRGHIQKLKSAAQP